ncbi:putative glyoxalase superfamily protein PhnB [Luteibacter sp. Sphag1AF]|uniref:VOC family protein n=1 Tax=Luteibacter sp. Sphag1AF TaxID=2587031 RepID=UPI001618FA84|nr:VOC family protein [Luteibacter sp. Sphag1AF]MBB3226505.1 putative glyoxalase superfamily protein PhnB [Luteibacter sp. Sphag1AF]
MSTGSTIIPCLRYRDAHAAIAFLCKAFGFTQQAVYEDAQGQVEHAQLTYGSGMVMLGSVRDDTPFGQLMMQPDEAGGRQTQCSCITVTHCRAHYDNAVAAGAIIVDAYSEKEYGGAGYSARDPEGHLWYIGSYDPWKGP